MQKVAEYEEILVVVSIDKLTHALWSNGCQNANHTRGGVMEDGIRL